MWPSAVQGADDLLTLLMDEIRQQRWLFGVLAIATLIVGALEFRHISSEDRLFGVVLLASGAALGFGVMFVRERYLRRSGKRPLDKPPQSVTLGFVIAGVGLAGFTVVLDPSFKVLIYGIMLGVMIGLIAYIGADIRRLRPSPDS
jgi:drug/metabolite transporter (DMT)-like permease